LVGGANDRNARTINEAGRDGQCTADTDERVKVWMIADRTSIYTSERASQRQHLCHSYARTQGYTTAERGARLRVCVCRFKHDVHGTSAFSKSLIARDGIWRRKAIARSTRRVEVRMERVYQQPGLNPRADIDVFVCWCVSKEIERDRDRQEYQEEALTNTTSSRWFDFTNNKRERERENALPTDTHQRQASIDLSPSLSSLYLRLSCTRSLARLLAPSYALARWFASVATKSSRKSRWWCSWSRCSSLSCLPSTGIAIQIDQPTDRPSAFRSIVSARNAISPIIIALICGTISNRKSIRTNERTNEYLWACLCWCVASLGARARSCACVRVCAFYLNRWGRSGSLCPSLRSCSTSLT